MYTVSRSYTFAAAHRVQGHPKCGRLHGHNYRVEVHLGASELDGQSMVLDFGDLDRVVKPLVDELDHRYIVSASNLAGGDPYYKAAIDCGDVIELDIAATTAECLAEYFHGQIRMLLPLIFPYFAGLVYYLRVSVQETERSVATYESQR